MDGNGGARFVYSIWKSEFEWDMRLALMVAAITHQRISVFDASWRMSRTLTKFECDKVLLVNRMNKHLIDFDLV